VSLARALRSAALAACLLACTTRETGSIDLLPSPSGSAKPGKPPPCSTDLDCPGDPKHRLCRVDDGACVECLVSADCADRPEPVCDAKGNCVPCRPGETPCADAAPEPPQMPP
jgi:hypothetical protein